MLLKSENRIVNTWTQAKWVVTWPCLKFCPLSFLSLSLFIDFICYIMPETWNINSVVHRSYSLCSWKALPHFLALEKCCIRIRNLSAVSGPFGTVAKFAVLTHTAPAHTCTHTHTHGPVMHSLQRPVISLLLVHIQMERKLECEDI